MTSQGAIDFKIFISGELNAPVPQQASDFALSQIGLLDHA